MKNLNSLITRFLLFFTTALFAQNLTIYVSDAANFTSGEFKIVKFDENGENAEVFISTELAWPQDILFLEDQNVVLISNLNSGKITKYDSSTGVFIDDFASGIAGPTRMKIGADGYIYVLQWSANTKVLRYDQDGTFIDEFTNTNMNQSIGLDWDDSGNLYVSSFNGAHIYKFDTTGASQGIFIDSNLSGPTNVKIDDGVIHVLDWNTGKLVRFNVSDGSYIDDFITGLTNPEGIDRLPNGNFLIGDNGTNSVREFDNGGNDQGEYTIGGGLITPNAVVLRDETLAIEEFESNKVFVTPTVGNRFTLNQSVISEYEALNIYNVSGVIIDTIDTRNSSIWNASKYSEGLYFISVTKGGKKATQKIVIKN